MDASYKIQRGIHVHLIQFFMCPEFWVHIIKEPSFLGGFFGVPLNGKQGKCIDTCNFRAAETLVGVPPNPLDFCPP